ncbi:MAG TPA: alpha-amylase family glycosyl hydrolase, partial [Terriglobales bacterium]|nr:alpha-amylase family glycosyl hydrolase [Terriglobales bacterium]
MSTSPTFEFHVSRAARDRYRFDEALFSVSGNVVFANLPAVREFAHRMNRVREAERHPELAIHPGALNAMGLIDEALHVLVAIYREQRDPKVIVDALAWFEARLGKKNLDRTLLVFAEEFPTVAVYRGEQSTEQWLKGSTGGTSHRAMALEELLMLWLANANPAFRHFCELFDDKEVKTGTSYEQLTATMRDYFETRPRFGPDNQNLFDMLRAPALTSPDSLEGQLAFIRDKWASLLGDFIQRLLRAMDVLKEEEMAIWMMFHPPGAHFGGPQALGDSGVGAIPQFAGQEFEYERFSKDVEWMPKAVLIAKTVYVWLDQLSKAYRRHIHKLDQIPDEELNTLARRGFNALWLIGVWERSRASQRIKQLTGNPDAVASAYSLADYRIADDLGGEAAYANLRDRAWARGIRLASDMVPNHMGIDSRWVIEHPTWFLSLPYSPFPSYRFDGPDLSSDGRVEIKIEDHYFDRTDAAVVFRRVDRWTGDTRFVYHGNDGTSFPWNDTAQLDYLNPEVREAVIQTILHVARQFPIIRFDAAMTLAKRHYQRLWYPAPGTGGAIPSRSEHGMTREQFDRAMPVEFWREVVDRV